MLDLALAPLLPWTEFAPDFAVVGVEKCGTTALAAALDAQPDIQARSEESDVSAALGGSADARTNHRR